jgi:hypothetical protein
MRILGFGNCLWLKGGNGVFEIQKANNDDDDEEKKQLKKSFELLLKEYEDCNNRWIRSLEDLNRIHDKHLKAALNMQKLEPAFYFWCGFAVGIFVCCVLSWLGS